MKKKLPLVIYFSFLIIYLELVYKVFVLNNVLSINSLTVILFSIPFIMINTILCSLFIEKVNRGISIILSLFLTFIFVSQYDPFFLRELKERNFQAFHVLCLPSRK